MFSKFVEGRLIQIKFFVEKLTLLGLGTNFKIYCTGTEF